MDKDLCFTKTSEIIPTTYEAQIKWSSKTKQTISTTKNKTKHTERGGKI